MYITIITAQQISTGKEYTHYREMTIPLSLADVREPLLSIGWLALSVSNEKLIPTTTEQ